MGENLIFLNTNVYKSKIQSNRCAYILVFFYLSPFLKLNAEVPCMPFEVAGSFIRWTKNFVEFPPDRAQPNFNHGTHGKLATLRWLCVLITDARNLCFTTESTDCTE